MADLNKKILYVQYTNPAAFPPLENSAWLLANRGWKVKFIGTQALGLENVKLLVHPNIEVELIPFCPPGLKQKLNYFRFLNRAIKEIIFGKYHCLYVSDLFASPIGWLGSTFLGAKVFYHEHDTPESAQSLFTRFLHWTRVRLSSKADLCIFPQTDRATAFAKEFKHSKVQVCFNAPLTKMVSGLTRWEKNTPFTLWYHGSLIEERLPFQVVEALSYLPDYVNLKFAGYETLSSQGFIQRIFDFAKKCGVEKRIEYCGVLATREELFEVARKNQLGLVLFRRKFVEPMVGASNKPFDFLACGMPLLFNDSKEWVNFFESRGVGKSCDPENPQSIAKAVLSIVENDREFGSMREMGLKQIKEEWNYETQFAPIQKLLEA